jgi:hypothetical protein
MKVSEGNTSSSDKEQQVSGSTGQSDTDTGADLPGDRSGTSKQDDNDKTK